MSDPGYRAGSINDPEFWLLATAMNSSEIAARVVADIEPHEFEHQDNRVFFTAMQVVQRAGLTPDAVTMGSRLSEKDLLTPEREQCLVTLQDAGSSESKWPYVNSWLAMIRERFDRRRFLAAIDTIHETARANGKPAGELYADTVVKLAQAAPRAADALVVHTLQDLLLDPKVLEPPPVVVPRLAWRGRVTLLAGREKDGKSTLALAGAAALSAGREFLGEPTTTEPALILVVSIDEHLHDTVRTLARFQARPTQVLIVPDLGPDRIQGLRNIVRSRCPDLTIIDSLSMLTAGLVKDGGEAIQWAPHMAALTALARETSTAVILIHHARKSDGKYRDSSEIGARVDMILEMQPGPDPTSRDIKAKGRWACPDYSVRLQGDLHDPGSHIWYTIETGDIPLSGLVYAHIVQSPGISRLQLRKLVGGRPTHVLDAVNDWVRRGAVVDVPDARGSRLYPAGQEPKPDPEIDLGENASRSPEDII